MDEKPTELPEIIDRPVPRRRGRPERWHQPRILGFKMVIAGGVIAAIHFALYVVGVVPDEPVTLLERIEETISAVGGFLLCFGLILWFATTVLDSLNQL